MLRVPSAALLCVCFLASCGTSKKPVVVGSKNETEEMLLGEIVAQHLEHRLGHPVERRTGLGGTAVLYQSILSGEVGIYPEYTGTGLINILQQSPKSEAQTVYKIVSEAYKKNWNLVWLKPSEANDSQGLVTTRKIAEKYNLYTVSKLATLAPQLRLAAVPEFEEREDGLKGLKKAYGGFNFKSVQLYDYGVKYRVILKGEADVTVGFTTDGDLSNNDLVLLKDDKNFWPPYNVAPVIRGQLLESDPNIAKVLDKVSAKLNNTVLQGLNAEVDIKKREYTEVAKEFLQKEGLIVSK